MLIELEIFKPNYIVKEFEDAIVNKSNLNENSVMKMLKKINHTKYYSNESENVVQQIKELRTIFLTEDDQLQTNIVEFIDKPKDLVVELCRECNSETNKQKLDCLNKKIDNYNKINDDINKLKNEVVKKQRSKKARQNLSYLLVPIRVNFQIKMTCKMRIRILMKFTKKAISKNARRQRVQMPNSFLTNANIKAHKLTLNKNNYQNSF